MTRTLIVVVLTLCAVLGCSSSGDEPESRSALQLVMLGPPGAGKGTQASRIHDRFAIPHISTGDILRAEVAAETDLGLEVKEVMERGDLVADEIVLELVDKRIAQADCDAGFILDGFPRTIPQAEGLDKILKKQGKGHVTVIDIAVPDEALLPRLLARKRADDTEATIKNRIEVYHEKTAPLIEYYERKGRLLRVNGDQSIDDVFAEIAAVLEQLD